MIRPSFSRLSAVLSVCWLLGCGNTDAPPRDYGPLLAKLSDQVILPEHQAFATQADALVDSVQALVDGPDAHALTNAQDAWRAARQAYRTLDALHFGPGYTLHISERIDVAPAEPSDIEKLASGTGSISDSTISNAGGHEKGFLGLEYLLFADSAAEDSSAPALAADDLADRRRALALAMAHEIAKSAHQLDDAWEPGASGYIEQIKTAGTGSTQYANQRAAVDAMVGGVAYALEVIVGVRLADPLGRKSTDGKPDPSLDPTLRSDSAVADMQATLAGIQAMYDGDGFSAVIRGKSSKLDDVVLAKLNDVQAALGAIPTPFGSAVLDDTPLVQAAFDVSSDLKKTWNTDVSSALGATLKPSDNDGD